MSKEKGENERFESSGSYEDLNGDKEVETPKAAGVIAEWREMNRKLRYHGYQPVMVLPCSQLQQIPRGAVVLEELTSKTLRETLAKLMTDCDRRQSMVQQLITSSRRIQKDADEERNRVYHYEMKIRNLQKELDEEKLKTQEMERMHLVELQNHGEVKELKRSISEVVALHTKLEQKVAQKEAEITRLQQQCQDLTDMKEKKLGGQSSELKSKCKNDKVDQKLLDFIDNYESQLSKIEQDVDHLKKQTETDLTVVCSDVEPSTSQSESSASISTANSLPKEGDGSDMVTGPTANIVARKKEIKVVQDKFMSAEKQLKDSKKLIKLLESENTCLKMELESRPNREEWKNSRKYNRQLEKLLALNNLRPPHQKHKDKRSVKTESSASRQRQYATQVEDIGFLPTDVCRSYLKEVCSGLEVIDLKDILDKIHIMKLSMQSYPAMERLIKDIIDVVNSEDAPRLTTEVLSEGTHEFHCERAWLNIVPILRVWLRELSGLKDLQASVMKLSLQLKPWKSESELKRDRRPLTVQSIREAVDILSQENRASPSEIRTGEETSLDQLKSIVAHFQNLFDVNTIEGTFPRMSEVYMRLGESSNLMNNLRDILGLEQACKASDIVNVVAKLSKAKHLLKVEDLHGIIKRLDQYDEFFPAFQSLVSELKKLLRVQEMDEILTAVTALVNFPNY